MVVCNEISALSWMYCSKSRVDRSSLNFGQQFSSSPHWIFFRVLFFSSPIESFLCSRATLVIWLFSQSYSETELDTIWDTCFRSWIEFCNFCFLEFPLGFVLCLRRFEFFKSQISYLNQFFCNNTSNDEDLSPTSTGNNISWSRQTEQFHWHWAIANCL